MHPKIHVKPPHPLLANPLLQLGAQNGTTQNGVTPTSAPLNVGAAFGAAGAALGLPTPLMTAQMRGGENGIEAGKKENQNNAYPNCSPRSPSERASAGKDFNLTNCNFSYIKLNFFDFAKPPAALFILFFFSRSRKWMKKWCKFTSDSRTNPICSSNCAALFAFYNLLLQKS